MGFLYNINKLQLKLFVGKLQMSQVARNLKFKAKIAQKSIHKSSLPQIDASYALNAKLKRNISVKSPQNNNKQASLKEQLILNLNKGLTQTKAICSIRQNIQSDKLNNLQSTLMDKNQVQVQKQLTTADTSRLECKQNTKIQNIKETSSKGFDMWNLNNNLKQFSQTRKLKFYNHKEQKSINSTLQSPYTVMNKTRTQQIRSVNKLCDGNSSNPQRERSQAQFKLNRFYDPIKRTGHKLKQKDAKSFSTISKKQTVSSLISTLYGTLPVRNKGNNLNPALCRKDDKPVSQSKLPCVDGPSLNLNPYLRTFVNGSHLRKQTYIGNINTMEMKSFGSKEPQNGQTKKDAIAQVAQKHSNDARKNRFEKIQQSQNQNLIDRTFDDQYSRSIKYEVQISPQHNPNQAIQEQKAGNQFQDSQFRSSSSPTKGKYDPTKRAEEKMRQYEYNRSIERINKFLLKSSKDYMEYYTFCSMPASKIDFYIDSLNHPEFNGHTAQYKSSYHGDCNGQVLDGFDFKQAKSPAKKQKTNQKRTDNPTKTS